MIDLSAKIAEFIHTDRISVGICENDRVSRFIKLIHERYPEATMDEIMRGFRISIELLEQEKEKLKKKNKKLEQEISDLKSKLR